jgi:translocation and assembly module TamB
VLQRLGKLLRAAGYALLGLASAIGVALADAGLLASTGPGSRPVAAWAAAALEGLVAGHFKLGGLFVRPGGGIELRDLEITDPAGHPVLRVALGRARLDLSGLGRRSVGVELELERPELWLEPGERGRLTIVDAFVSPAAEPNPRAAAGADPWHGWTIRIARLDLRQAAVHWRGDGGRTWLEAVALDVGGAGQVGASGVFAELEAAGTLQVPLQGPLSIDLAARIVGTQLTVSRLALGAAGSRLEAFGELDWERETFRAAATRLALAEPDATALAGQRVTGGDLEGTLYAESDGERITASLELSPPRGGSGGGRVALDFRPGGSSPRTFGFDVALSGLDPSRVLARAPRGRLAVAARGAVSWPLPGPGPFSRGHVTVDRLDVRLPGLALSGEGRWRDAGAMAGALRLQLPDLALAGPAVAALLGVTLPELSGSAEAELGLAGSAAAPELMLAVRAPRCRVAGLELTEGLVDARLAGAGLELAASAGLGALDGAQLSSRGAATLAPGWRGARVERLELGLAGQAWTLGAPATVRFDGPRVDRAAFRSGGQRLAITGGSDAAGLVELRVEAEAVDLARLPPALVPASLGLAGAAGGSLHLAGRPGRRTLDARVAVAGGALRAFTGLTVKGELAWRAETGRARLEGSLRGAGGGALELVADLPWPVAGAAPGQAVSGRLAVTGWQLQALLAAAGLDLPAEGRLGGEFTLTGSAGAPHLQGRAELSDGRWADLSSLDLSVALEGPGATLRTAVELKLAGVPVGRARVELPYQRGALLAHPLEVVGRLHQVPWTTSLQVVGVDLAALSGKVGVPAGLSGRISGQVALTGTPLAPRGRGSLALDGVTLVGYPALDGPLTFALEEGRTSATAALESGGTSALRLSAAVAAPVEALGDPVVQRRAALAVNGSIPGLTLPERPGERWSLSGLLAVTLEATGTLAAPRAGLAIDASGLKLGGLPFGDLKGTARTTGEATLVDLTLAPAEGGTLRCEGSIAAAPGIQSPVAALLDAPLRVEVTGHDLGAGFLPSLLPGRVRSVSGTVQASLSVTGSPRAPHLAGALALAGGQLTLPGWGTFTGIGFEAAFDPRRIRLQGLTLRRGAGRVEGELLVDGLDGAEARLGGALQVTGFSLARGGMDLATIDARAALGGRYREERLEVEVTIERGGTVRLPRKAPRTLQPIEDRPDIVIGELPARPAGGAAGANGAGEPPAVVSRPALAVTIRVRGEELLLKSDQPRVNVALRTDSTWEVTASPIQVGGSLEAYQGNFEPLAGRLFKVVRGRVVFPGSQLMDAQLDLAADYENPSAKVHATVSGTLEKPNLRLTSVPPLDEASLAMLIVTGRAEVTVGGTQGSAFSAQDAGMAAAMAMANKVFEEQLGEKMPVDSLTLDSSAVTAAKQLTDRILVSYIRRFDARPDKGENVDEVRVQYHMTRRWTLETRYGNAGAGGASVIWQKDY